MMKSGLLRKKEPSYFKGQWKHGVPKPIFDHWKRSGVKTIIVVELNSPRGPRRQDGLEQLEPSKVLRCRLKDIVRYGEFAPNWPRRDPGGPGGWMWPRSIMEGGDFPEASSRAGFVE